MRRFIRPWQAVSALAAALGLVSICWWVSGVQVQAQRQHHLTETKLSAVNEAQLLASVLSSRMAQIQGVAESLALDPEMAQALLRFGAEVPQSSAPLRELASMWQNDVELQPLAQRLDRLAHKLDLNALMLVNAAGDCVASGTLEGTRSLTGFNYRDRFYFQEALAGRSAREFVVGRATSLHMLVFSAPIWQKGRFLGMTAVAIDISKLRPPVRSPSHYLVTDGAGVVVQASRPEWMMRALPQASILSRQDAAQNIYKRTRFEPLDWPAGPWPGTVRIGPEPPGDAADVRIRAEHALPDGLLRVHVLAPYLWEGPLQRERWHWFMALSFAALLLLALAFSGALFVSLLRRQDAALLALNRDLVALSRTDPLTGCANRRHFLETLDLEQERSRRSGRPYCLLSLDLDHFKQVNDTHGHAAGDAVLRAFTHTVQLHLRKTDALGRLGGEEFSVLLPETTATEGARVAEKIRAQTEANQVEYNGQAVRWTVSIGGVQSQPDNPAPPAKWLEASDRALYQAKSQGRNRVVWA